MRYEFNDSIHSGVTSLLWAPLAAKQATLRHEFLEVTTAAEVQNETDYLDELARYNQQATMHESRVIQELLGFYHVGVKLVQLTIARH